MQVNALAAALAVNAATPFTKSLRVNLSPVSCVIVPRCRCELSLWNFREGMTGIFRGHDHFFYFLGLHIEWKMVDETCFRIVKFDRAL